MNQKTLVQAFIGFVACLLLALSSCFFQDKAAYEQTQGKSTFGKIATKEDSLSHLEIKMPKTTITFEKTDGLWQIKEADFYYANYQSMAQLENFIKNSKILNEINLSSEESQILEKNGITIKVYNKQKQEQAEIAFMKPQQESKIAYAKIKGRKGFYTIENELVFPEKIILWLQQPLLSLNKTGIKSITINGQTAERKITENIYKTNNQDTYKTDRLLKMVEFLLFEKVLSAQNFDEKLYQDKKTIELKTFDGMIVNLTLYKKDNDYWLKQKISTTSLPTANINDYVKNNAFLYDYWYFKLPRTVGQELWSEEI